MLTAEIMCMVIFRILFAVIESGFWQGLSEDFQKHFNFSFGIFCALPCESTVRNGFFGNGRFKSEPVFFCKLSGFLRIFIRAFYGALINLDETPNLLFVFFRIFFIYDKDGHWKIFAAGLISLAAYLLPFLLASAKKDYEDSGLALVFQENIQRYFDSLDHKQAWYAYFIHLPQLMMPWTPILVLAIIASIRNWKKADHSERWILVCIAVIFAVFSISDSKRVYYILPILPYCSILCAVFVLSETTGIWEKLRNIVLKIYFWLIPATAAALLGLTVYGYAFSRKIRLIRYGLKEGSQLVLPVMLLTALILLVIWALFWRKLAPELFPNRKTGRDFAACAGACSVLLIAFFGIAMPLTSEMFRTEKPFFGQILSLAEKYRIPKDRIYFFHHNYTNGSFYLKHERKIPVLDHEGTAKSKELGTELAKLLKESQGQRFIVIGQMRYFRKISSPELRQQILDRLNLIEPSGPAENPKKNGKKYAVLLQE